MTGVQTCALPISIDMTNVSLPKRIEIAEETLQSYQAHLIKAISHHFALPEADLIKAINDYKGDGNEQK